MERFKNNKGININIIKYIFKYDSSVEYWC